MLSSFENDRYVSEDWFRREQEEIFSKLWIFLGLKTMVDKPNRFMTRDIAGVPVVVQNFDGEIRAFRNVCLHRQMKLQHEEFGERRLICGYHGWRYDSTGAVAAVPLNDSYHRLSDEETCGLHLENFRLEIVGDFIFINLDPSPLPIERQFSAQILADLGSMSGCLDRDMLIAKIPCDYNWKLIYENLRDVIHPRFLHQQTLTLDVLIEAGELPADFDARRRRTPNLIDLSYGGPAHPFTKDRTPAYAAKVERWGQTNAYFNWLLFPNTHIISPNGGYTFSIEHHVPVAAGKTELLNYYMTAKTKGGGLPASVLWESMQGAREVLDEDNRAMAQVQGVIGRGPRSPILGGGEYEIGEMQNWIAAAVGANS